MQSKRTSKHEKEATIKSKSQSKIGTKRKERPRNYIGESFRRSSRVSKLRFEAAILEASDNDGFNYWRTFRLRWQYEPKINKIPYLYVKMAETHLKLGCDLPDGCYDETDMMFALRMVAPN